MNAPLAVALFSVGLALSPIAPIHAQAPSLPLSSRVQPDRVILDALFFDQAGKRIHDLTANDIEIRQEGKKVRLDTLDFASPASASPLRARGGVFSASSSREFSQPLDPAVVVVVDLSSLDQRLSYVTGQIAALAAANPNVRLRVLVLGQSLQMILDFDSDRSELPARLEAIQPLASTDGQRLSTFLGKLERLFDRSSFEGNFDNLIDSARSAVAEAASVTAEIENRVSRLATSLAFIASSLRSEPGRKHVWLFSSGYPINAAPTLRDMIQQRFEAGIVGRQLENEERARLSVVLSNLENRRKDDVLLPAIDQCNRSQVSIYSIDSRGLLTSQSRPLEDSRSGTRGQESLYSGADRTLSLEFLNELSDGTGGLVIRETGDLINSSQRLLGDLEEYALISFNPVVKPRGGKFSRLEFRVKRPGITAFVRRGYVPLSAAEIDKERINAAFNLPSIFGERDLQVEVEASQPASTIQVMIPTEILQFDSHDQRFSNRIEIFGILLDAQGKRVSDSLLFGKRHQLDLTPQELSDFRSRSHLISRASAPIPAGRYQLIVVVRQGPAEEISCKILELVI